MIAVFIYNIILIVLYTITMSISLIFYLREKRKVFLAFSVYLAFFIFDNVIIYMTEFFNTFAHQYNQTFMSIPAAKTIIFVVNAFCSLWIVRLLAKDKMKPYQNGILILLAVWMLSTPLLANSAFKVWLYYLPNQLFLFYLGGYAWYNYKKALDISPMAKKYLKRIGLLAMIFSVAILCEDTFVIFNVDQYSSLTVKIFNRNLCEDIFSILACLIGLNYFLRSHSQQPAEEVAAEVQQERCFEQFCQTYQFTQREMEIFRLLLEHKQNQEIADELFLSVGTVKTHVHNIFIKLDIKKRTQIQALYEQYKLDLKTNLLES
ncbi:response regulator transcription factor [Enterococcus sp. 669A]|uniref:Response regulator transcription factor n=1 Tax=Candidatus Enterococcus moelleringii TaxID=2815325 RepID=A0ABS3L7X3_9ENTE|nr:LuxR C-terminal-related transcriptional regulator [Enterococcus sp. 669A]MBO1305190.1 response regulator transcription factor [Enterococcus sp. 669A]